jgi:hypothetical protein
MRIIFICVALVIAFVSSGCAPQWEYRDFGPSTVGGQSTSYRAVHPTVSDDSYQYGRFRVIVSPNGSQRIIGGRFMPPGSPPVASSFPHLIAVNFSTKELQYYRGGYGGYEPIVGWAVVTPDAHTLPLAEVRGRVTRIDTRPTWCPTDNMRRIDPSLPTGCVPFGDPRNAMGDAKFEIDWNVRGWSAVRLHGTRGYPQGNFWHEETFGCVRLHNPEIRELIALLGPSAVAEGIEVVFHR